jgi:uncharacterized membrane protein
VFLKKDDVPGVLITPVTYRGAFDTAFNGIRQDCRNKVAVVIRLLEALDTLAYLAETEEQKDAVKTHIKRIIASGQNMDFESDDRTDFDERVEVVRKRAESLG